MAREMTRAELLAIDGVKPAGEAKRISLLGEFKWKVKNTRGEITITDGWDSKHLVTVVCPQLQRIGNPTSGRVTIHKLLAPQFLRFWELVEQLGLLNRVLTWDGCFYARLIRGSSKTRSSHSWGGAFDINVAWNMQGNVPAAVGQRGSVRELVGIAEACGFGWGGHWSGRTVDGMHFDLFRIVPAAELPVLAASVPEPTPDDDPDIATWAADDVAELMTTEIMRGYPDGTFRGANPVSRQELAIVVARTLRHVDRNYGRLSTPRSEGEIRS